MARVVKWIKSLWAITNVDPKSLLHSYNSEPVAQTRNTLLQLVMEKVTHQIPTSKNWFQEYQRIRHY